MRTTTPAAATPTRRCICTTQKRRGFSARRATRRGRGRWGGNTKRRGGGKRRLSGARPLGVKYETAAFRNMPLVGGTQVWPETTWLAANVPGWTPYKLVSARYQSRYLANSGRLFFNSHDALTPQDVNGNEDVYQYEPPGIGDCSGSNAAFSPRSGGCVSLISSGSSVEESAFLDASESGDDVFFLTSAKLSPQDFDTSLDVYDAHVCSGAAPCFPEPAEPPPPCDTGDSCKASPPPQPEIFGAPASATFSGAGNITPPPEVKGPPKLTKAQKLAKALRACRKKPKKKRPACERQARRAYGTAQKASKHKASKSH